MSNRRYGDPILTARLPRWQIVGLKVMAEETGRTVSEIIREHVAAYLAENGITESLTKIAGQIEMDFDE